MDCGRGPNLHVQKLYFSFCNTPTGSRTPRRAIFESIDKPRLLVVAMEFFVCAIECLAQIACWMQHDAS